MGMMQFYVISGLFLCVAAFKLYTERHRIKKNSPLAADLSKIFTAFIALIAVIVTATAYHAANANSITQATVEIRKRLIASIDENTRAAISLIALYPGAMKVITESRDIDFTALTKLDKSALQASAHFGRFVTDKSIPANIPNKLRFALVKELNEYENLIRSINLRLIDCEQVTDLMVEIARSPNFAQRFNYAVIYDELHEVTDDLRMRSWGIMRQFRCDVSKILDQLEQRNKTISPHILCAKYAAVFSRSSDLPVNPYSRKAAGKDYANPHHCELEADSRRTPSKTVRQQ